MQDQHRLKKLPGPSQLKAIHFYNLGLQDQQIPDQKRINFFNHCKRPTQNSSLRLQPPFTILDAEDKDVVEVDFLMFKNVSSGKPGYMPKTAHT